MNVSCSSIREIHFSTSSRLTYSPSFLHFSYVSPPSYSGPGPTIKNKGGIWPTCPQISCFLTGNAPLPLVSRLGFLQLSFVPEPQSTSLRGIPVSLLRLPGRRSKRKGREGFKECLRRFPVSEFLCGFYSAGEQSPVPL